MSRTRFRGGFEWWTICPPVRRPSSDAQTTEVPEGAHRSRGQARDRDPHRDLIDDWLRADLDAPRKQRHTSKRIFDRLLDEHEAAGVVSYGMVRDYVATRRREIRIDAGREAASAFVPQDHKPGREAEVDFGDVAIRLRDELATCTLVSLRLSYSGKAVHRIGASAGQEASFEGHVHAFRVLGGVPAGKIRYDNVKAAVASVVGTRASASKRIDGPRSGRTTASTRSTVSLASRERARKA